MGRHRRYSRDAFFTIWRIASGGRTCRATCSTGGDATTPNARASTLQNAGTNDVGSSSAGPSRAGTGDRAGRGSAPVATHPSPRTPSPMRPTRIAALPLLRMLAVLAAACGAAGPSPSSAAPTPTARPADAGRPVALVRGAGRGGLLAPDDDVAGHPAHRAVHRRPDVAHHRGRAVPGPGAIPMIYPGPLVGPIFARQVTDAGRQQIVTWAKDLGPARREDGLHRRRRRSRVASSGRSS